MSNQIVYTAEPVLDDEFSFARQIQTNEHVFIFLSRKSTLAQSIPAEKVSPVEFFLKP